MNSMVKEDLDSGIFYELSREFFIDNLNQEIEEIKSKMQAEAVKSKAEMTRKLLNGKLGEIPGKLETIVEKTSSQQLDQIFVQAMRNESYD